MNGVINIDKPAGMTSHDVVYKIRRLAGQKRVGHAGTLDPDATGVLLICLGYATRLSDLLADQGKTYDAVLRLGVTTSTEDASGDVLAELDPSQINRDDLAAVVPQFVGSIAQIPPMVSAVHHHGKRLYEIARQGLIVEREARPVEIHSIELLEFTPGPLCTAKLHVACGKGTYIRTLCADIGGSLGVGGHMGELRRTSVGQFDITTAVSLEDLTTTNVETFVIPAADAISFLPMKMLTSVEEEDVRHGKQITSTEEFVCGSLVRLVWQSELVAIARVIPGEKLQPEKVFPNTN
jgi:tRNA pseudouridine55 synthase